MTELEKLITLTIKDMVANLLFYDRKEDEELTLERLTEALRSKEITAEYIINTFRIAVNEHMEWVNRH